MVLFPFEKRDKKRFLFYYWGGGDNFPLLINYDEGARKRFFRSSGKERGRGKGRVELLSPK